MDFKKGQPMKQYKCNGCSERCGSTASDRPSQCLFHADSKCPKWELVEQPVRNNYATIQRYAAPVINWKKAFEILVNKLRLPAGWKENIESIISKCTEGGE